MVDDVPRDCSTPAPSKPYIEVYIGLKDTGHFLVTVKDQYSHLVFLNWSSKLQENNE